MSIICIGQCAYDLTFPIQEPLIENQKYRIMEPFSCIGAPAANAAYLCALWNAETVLISRCGKDFYGAEIRRVLKEAGVDTAYLMAVSYTHLSECTSGCGICAIGDCFD